MYANTRPLRSCLKDARKNLQNSRFNQRNRIVSPAGRYNTSQSKVNTNYVCPEESFHELTLQVPSSINWKINTRKAIPIPLPSTNANHGSQFSNKP